MPAVLRSLAGAENSIERWWQQLEAATKHSEGSGRVVNALAMAASYDPDPPQFLSSSDPAADHLRYLRSYRGTLREFAPCAALTRVPTVALVMTLSGIRSQANSGRHQASLWGRCEPRLRESCRPYPDPGRSDKVTRFDVGEAFLDKGDDVDIRRERNRQRLAVAGFDRQIVVVELLDGAADAGRCAVRRRV
jgi:hypothetical protein